MNRDEFEARVLAMWMKTRIPLTRANLQYVTGTSRRELNKRLDELTVDGVVEADVDDDGEMLWTVPGAARAPDGATTVAEHDKRESLRAEARQKLAARRGKPAGELSTALTLAREVGSLERPRGAAVARAGQEDKSVLVGAGLGLLGPLGWLYAGSFKETVPAALLLVLLYSFVPTFLFLPLLPLLLPVSAIVGGLYAHQHNKSGERQTLFLDKKKPTGDE